MRKLFPLGLIAILVVVSVVNVAAFDSPAETGRVHVVSEDELYLYGYKTDEAATRRAARCPYCGAVTTTYDYAYTNNPYTHCYQVIYGCSCGRVWYGTTINHSWATNSVGAQYCVYCNVSKPGTGGTRVGGDH